MQDRDPMPTHSTQSTPPRRRIPVGILAGLAVAMLAAGSGTAWWTWNSQRAQAPTSEAPTSEAPTSEAPTQPASPASPTTTEQNVQVYWLKSVDAGFELVPAPVSVATAEQPQPLLEAALEAMLQGDTPSADLTSTIPAGTQLRQVEVKADGVHVDLSQEFTSGGGSASMTGRVGQIVYTATTLEPDAPVWIAVEGEPLEVLGGEGLLIDQPMTREAFQQNFSL
jgi:spore germination protein GerM